MMRFPSTTTRRWLLACLVLLTLAACQSSDPQEVSGQAPTPNASDTDSDTSSQTGTGDVSPAPGETVTSEPTLPAAKAPAPTETAVTIDVASLPAAPGTEFNPEGFNDRAGRGFRSLDDPKMILAEAATWIEPDALVLGVLQYGEAQAFPVNQMAYPRKLCETYETINT